MAEHELEIEERAPQSGPERYAVPPQGAIPNSALPLLVWRGVAEGGDRAERLRAPVRRERMGAGPGATASTISTIFIPMPTRCSASPQAR